MLKLIVDFTLIIHFRHPFELGGAYWSINIVLNQIFCFVALILYTRYLNEEITANAEFEGYSVKVPLVRCNATDVCKSNSTDICYRDDFICGETVLESSLWALVAGLFSISMISFGLFLISINREYLWTFFDTRTGTQFVTDNYWQLVGDNDKFNSFSQHRSLNRDIEEDLMKWIDDNWEKWEEEKPDWFTASAIASIPEDMLPVRVKNKLGGTKQERKNSLNKQIAEEAKAKKEEQERAQRDGDVDPVR